MANENETHEEVCAEMRSFGNVPPPMFAWRDLAERAEAAHKRELAAKDAEIARLKSCLAGDCERMRLGAEPCEGCHIERINERNEIIKEFIGCYDELDWCQDGDTHFCKEECAYEEDHEKCLALRIHRVMTKAREVVK